MFALVQRVGRSPHAKTTRRKSRLRFWTATCKKLLARYLTVLPPGFGTWHAYKEENILQWSAPAIPQCGRRPRIFCVQFKVSFADELSGSCGRYGRWHCVEWVGRLQGVNGGFFRRRECFSLWILQNVEARSSSSSGVCQCTQDVYWAVDKAYAKGFPQMVVHLEFSRCSFVHTRAEETHWCRITEWTSQGMLWVIRWVHANAPAWNLSPVQYWYIWNYVYETCQWCLNIS